MPSKIELNSICASLRNKYSHTCITYAVFMSISKNMMIKFGATHGVDFSDCFALRDHALILMTDDLGIDLAEIYRAMADLDRAHATLTYLTGLSADSKWVEASGDLPAFGGHKVAAVNLSGARMTAPVNLSGAHITRQFNADSGDLSTLN